MKVVCSIMPPNINSSLLNAIYACCSLFSCMGTHSFHSAVPLLTSSTSQEVVTLLFRCLHPDTNVLEIRYHRKQFVTDTLILKVVCTIMTPAHKEFVAESYLCMLFSLLMHGTHSFHSAVALLTSNTS